LRRRTRHQLLGIRQEAEPPRSPGRDREIRHAEEKKKKNQINTKKKRGAKLLLTGMEVARADAVVDTATIRCTDAEIEKDYCNSH
jgi:hypothetical protein